MATEKENYHVNPPSPQISELPAENLEKMDPSQRQLLAAKLGQRAEEDHIAPRADIEYIYDKIVTMSSEEAVEILNLAISYHDDDKNFPVETMHKITKLVRGPEESQLPPEEWEFDLKAEAAVIKYHSPYPEVRSIADPFDDPSIPVETIRSYFLGMIWSIIGMGVNTFFAPRFPSISLSSQIIQVLLYPCGKAMEFILPDWGFTMFGSRHSLNPGPWNYKEQMFATLTFNVCLTTIYVYWNFQVQKLSVFFDGDYVTFGYEMLLTLSNQCMGFGFAGMLRRFVIYPSKAIWPTILPTVALSRALLIPDRDDAPVHGWTITRYKYFFILFGGTFCYYWLPGFLFQALSVFNWMTWIAPNNLNLAIITGSEQGLGVNPWPTFDWLVFNQNGPFLSPFFAFFQQFVGTTLGMFVIIGVFYSKRKWTNYIPINTSDIFDNTGAPYTVTNVLDKDNKFSEELYKKYSPPYYSAANIVVYGAFFAFYPLNVVYMFFDQWKLARDAFVGFYRDLVFDLGHGSVRTAKVLGNLLRFNLAGAKEAYNAEGPERPSMYDGFKDAHSVMMMQYPEAPDWWFVMVFLVSFVFGILCIAIYPINTPYWTLFFVVGINAIYIVPMSIIYAVTGITEGLNVLTELIIGYALPGNAQALMFSKAFGYNIAGQADNYISDQKMAHYAKIPPRAVFRGQLIATIITSFVSVGVMNWQFSNIKGLCTPDQAQDFNCENGSVIYYSSAVVWGSIGPKRVFSQLYPELKWCFLIGFLIAVVFLVGQRGGPAIREWTRQRLPTGLFSAINGTIFKFLSWFKVINPAVVCNGFLLWAPLNMTYAISSMYVNYLFHYYIKRRYTAWWEKYTYVTAAALTGATAFSALIVFFAVQYHPKNLSWWGNNVSFTGLDGSGSLVLDTPANGTVFGIPIGEFF